MRRVFISTARANDRDVDQLVEHPVPPDRLAVRTATFDELLSDDFESLRGLKGDADLAAKRLAAWCKSCASGDWMLFSRRLERDGFATDQVLARFATARRRPHAPYPRWIDDAIWIQAGLHGDNPIRADSPTSITGRLPFEHVFASLVDAADKRLWDSIDASVAGRLTSSARGDLRWLLLNDLCSLCAPVLYERFATERPDDAAQQELPDSTVRYEQFILDMKSGGLRHLFGEKPVLFRLIASVTRQWLDSTSEFVMRLNADLESIRRDILQTRADSRVVGVKGGLSDPHRGGRAVLRVEFDDGLKVMYKPKDLRLDVAWRSLVGTLNAEAPVQLRAAIAIARDGYGWTEFVEHAGCECAADSMAFFRRAGAWLALFHCFAASDIHQENLIAAADYPVPVDMETLLQASAGEPADAKPEAQAFEAARELIANSVMTVGLLPAYGRSADNVYAVGGVASDWTTRTKLTWNHINSDRMRPCVVRETAGPPTNLPHVGGRYVSLGEHLDDFISGFRDYATFLRSHSRGLFDGFAGLPVRKVLRPTRFYWMLLQRLKNTQTMNDGVMWSAEADFLARLADWDTDDATWPLQRAERTALAELNVPLFAMPSDGSEISDTTGVTVTTSATSGLQRARDRVQNLDQQELDWQVDVIQQTSTLMSRLTSVDVSPSQPVPPDPAIAHRPATFLVEADRIVEEISRYAIRRGSSAAWIGLNWFTDSDVAQLAVIGHDLYNGTCGIATFLAAHAKTALQPASADLALAAVAHLRAELKSRRASRLARLLGIGGATGLGSIIYALTTISLLLRDDELLADAHSAAMLLSDERIEADKQLDVVGGSAGAILCLLRLYDATRADDVLNRAITCGEHLLAQQRIGPAGRRSWRGHGPNTQALNGMSHGAAGFAYALGSLATVTGREKYADAATECIEYERLNFEAERSDWRDFRVPEPHWRSQWCHGAVGIGLARLAMSKRGAAALNAVAVDIDNALTGATRGWPGHVDTLCCGALGSIELIREAAKVLNRSELSELSSRRLTAILQMKASTGDYRWNAGARRFNLGLFRGFAGVGYTCLREVDDCLPNLLIWE
jgi:type 2 lantibiotic biosynthesis protein LanM